MIIVCAAIFLSLCLQHVWEVSSQLGIEPLIIQGEELEKKGFGGIYGVGKAAIHQPALAVFSHCPAGATQTIAWVGKGIVYDTGGLSIKGKVRVVVGSSMFDQFHLILCALYWCMRRCVHVCV